MKDLFETMVSVDIQLRHYHSMKITHYDNGYAITHLSGKVFFTLNQQTLLFMLERFDVDECVEQILRRKNAKERVDLETV